MSRWVIVTKNKQAVYFAQKRGNDIIQHKNGFFIIIPITNSEAHRILRKFDGTIKINIETELYCTACKKRLENCTYIHSDTYDIPPCLEFD